MMILDALRKFLIRTAVWVRGASGPGITGPSFRLAGVRQPVVSSNQMRSSSQVMPVFCSRGWCEGDAVPGGEEFLLEILVAVPLSVTADFVSCRQL